MSFSDRCNTINEEEEKISGKCDFHGWTAWSEFSDLTGARPQGNKNRPRSFAKNCMYLYRAAVGESLTIGTCRDNLDTA